MLPLYGCYNNRFTHSEDVKCIAKKIYEYLKTNYNDNDFIKTLSIKKIETMAMWHDVGHCPYGHRGEEKLNSLISENNEFYWDSFYSGYKHNLLSAKILLDLKINVSWDIVDAAIKHSSTLPKNFNLTRANHDNILKLNYIFNCDRNNIIVKNDKKVAVNKSWYFFMKKFVYNFPCQICKVEKYDFISNNDGKKNDLIKVCDTDKCGNNCTYCVIDKDCNNIKHNITRYLLFPFPLTLSGEIIRIADEISALVRDIEYYSKYLKEKYNTKYYIIKEKVLDKFNILESEYFGQKKDYELLAKVKELIKLEINGDDVIDYLVKKINFDYESFEVIERREFNKIPLIVKWDNIYEKNYCKPLLEFEHDINKLFKKIKKIIYEIIHKDKFIDDDNDKGEKYIEKVFEYYYNNPSEFLSINSHLNNELNLITEEIQNLKFDTLVEKINFAKYNLDTDYCMKLLNSFRREIAFFIARLTEDELKKIYGTI